MSNNNYYSQRSSLPTNGLSRTFSPVAFFHDGISISEADLRFNIREAQRRAQAIATAPRRNRYDDEDEDNEQKKAHLGFIKTPAVPIPVQSKTQQTQSLPQTQSDISLIPNFRVNSPTRETSDELDYLYSHNSH